MWEEAWPALRRNGDQVGGAGQRERKSSLRRGWGM